MKEILVHNRDKYSRLLNNSVLFALGSLGSKFITFILIPLYTNVLSTEEYGTAELLITGVNFVVPFVSLSIKDATLRFTLDKNNKSGEVLLNSILVVIVGTMLTCLLFPVIAHYTAIRGWTQYFIVITVLYMVRDILSIYLKSIDKVKLFAIDSILYTLFLLISNSIFLLVFDRGLDGYFLATVISTSGSIIVLVIFGNVVDSFRNNKLNLKLLKNMIRFSAPMVFNTISWWFINSSDKVMIEYFDSTSAAGIYSISAKIPSLVTSLTSIFNQAWIISSVSEYDTTRDDTFFANVFSIFHCVLVIASSIIVLIIKPFMHVYVGESFFSSWQYVPLLLLGSVFSSYAAFFGAIYTSAKKNIRIMLTTLVTSVVNVILNYMLIPTMGIQGAVIATVIAYFLLFVFRMFDSQKYIRFRIKSGHMLSTFLVLTFQCVITLRVEGVFRFVLSCLCFMILIRLNVKTINILFDLLRKRMIAKKL